MLNVLTSKSLRSAAKYSTCVGYCFFSASKSLSVLATNTTLCDFSRRYFEIARPIPRPAPVTMMVFEVILVLVEHLEFEGVVDVEVITTNGVLAPVYIAQMQLTKAVCGACESCESCHRILFARPSKIFEVGGVFLFAFGLLT